MDVPELLLWMLYNDLLHEPRRVDAEDSSTAERPPPLLPRPPTSPPPSSSAARPPPPRSPGGGDVVVVAAVVIVARYLASLNSASLEVSPSSKGGGVSIAATRPRASAMRLSGDATLRRWRNDGSKPPLLLLLLEDEASVDVVDDASSSTPPPPPPSRRRSDGNLLPRFLPWDDARELSSEREGPRLLRFVVPSREDMSLSFGRRGGGPGGDDGDSQFLDPLFTILVVASSWRAWSSIVTSLVVSSSISAIGEEEEMVVVLRPPLLFPRKNSLGGFISSLCWGGSKEVCLSSCPKGNSSQSCRYMVSTVAHRTRPAVERTLLANRESCPDYYFSLASKHGCLFSIQAEGCFVFFYVLARKLSRQKLGLGKGGRGAQQKTHATRAGMRARQRHHDEAN